MILSKESLFSDGQAVTATALSTNVMDLGAAGTPHGASAPLNHDVGKGTPVPLLVQVTEDFNTLTSLTIAIETGAAATLGTVVASFSVPLADLKAGYRIPYEILPKGLGRYLGLRYTVVGTAPTTGKITAGLTMGVQNNVTGA